MNGINDDRNANTYNGFNRPVVNVDIGIYVFDVIHGNTEKDNGREQSVLRYTYEDCGIDDKSGEDAQEQIEDHSGPETTSDRQQLRK